MERELAERVVICGAGLAGCALGALLADRGWRVTLVEKRATAPHVGYTFTMQVPGWKALARLGVDRELREAGHVLPSFRIRTGSGWTLKQTDQVSSVLPGGVQMFRWAVLDALRRRAASAGCVLLTDTTLETYTVEDDGTLVLELSNGLSTRAELLVGADGMHSRVRELAGLGEAVADATWSAAMMGPARGDGFEMRYGIRDYFVIAPTGREHSHWVLTSRAPLPEGQEALVEAVRRGLVAVGEDPAVVEGADGLKLIRNEEVDIPAWSRDGRVVLVGDAAHGMWHTAGLGGSLAVGDAVALADALAEHAIPKALEVFEAERRPKVSGARALAHRGMMVNLPPRWALFLRNLVLWALPLSALAPEGLDAVYQESDA